MEMVEGAIESNHTPFTMVTKLQTYASVESGDPDVLTTRIPEYMRKWSGVFPFWIEMSLIGGLPGNLLTIVTYVKTPSLRTPTNHVICSLAMSDLLTCVIYQVAIVNNYLAINNRATDGLKYICLVTVWLGLSATSISLLHLLVLSLDRLLAVKWSLKYLIHVTEGAVLKVLVIIWISTLVLAGLPTMALNGWDYNSDVCFPLEVVKKSAARVISLLLAAILVAVVAINITIAKTAHVTSRVSPAGLPACPNAALRGSYKITKMLLLVVGSKLVTSLPLLIRGLVMPNLLYSTSKVAWVLSGVSRGLYMTNPLMNPFIYAWKDAKFRSSYRRILGCRRRTRIVHVT